jgi:hypothetical protein
MLTKIYFLYSLVCKYYNSLARIQKYVSLWIFNRHVFIIKSTVISNLCCRLHFLKVATPINLIPYDVLTGDVETHLLRVQSLFPFLGNGPTVVTQFSPIVHSRNNAITNL